MSAFEPISRGHAGFIDILHVGRTNEYLYYSMELADDHLAGREIDIVSYEPRTLKSDLGRQKRLSADESIRLGISLTEAYRFIGRQPFLDRKSTRLNSSHTVISYAVFCLKKKK